MKFKKRKFGFYASTLPVWSVVATILAMPVINNDEMPEMPVINDDFYVEISDS